MIAGDIDITLPQIPTPVVIAVVSVVILAVIVVVIFVLKRKP
jgi:hypothetical protein